MALLLIGMMMFSGCALNFEPPLKDGAKPASNSSKPSDSQTNTSPTNSEQPDSQTGITPTPAEESGSQTETTPTPTEIPTEIYLDPETGIYYNHYEREGETSERFELPLEGATGYAPVTMTVTAEASASSAAVVTLSPGDAFVILEEKDDIWWHITQDGSWDGWVENTYCYLNIPDVIPSIVFDNTNGYSSVFVSSGKEIPEITGEQLYESKFWNERLGEEQFVMAANYWMVKKIYVIQQAALADGYTLVLYEAFRPRDVQQKVVAQVKQLCAQDAEVKAGIYTEPWGVDWFISENLSKHQIGCAMDVSIAKVNMMEVRLSGKYRYTVVIDKTLCYMPTNIHELSRASASMVKPVTSNSKTAWKDVQITDTMTRDALMLREYCLNGGLYPLASEWWHFNDLDVKEAIGSHYTEEAYRLGGCVSRIPE